MFVENAERGIAQQRQHSFGDLTQLLDFPPSVLCPCSSRLPVLFCFQANEGILLGVAGVDVPINEMNTYTPSYRVSSQ